MASSAGTFLYYAQSAAFQSRSECAFDFCGPGFLNPAAPLPLSFLPFSFPTSKNFQYAVSHQANLTFEQDLGHDLSFSLAYNFNGGRHLNRPINANAVKPGPLLANWRVALGDPASGAATLGPEGVGAAGTPCGVNLSTGQPWVAAALANFFRPSGLNPALGQALLLSPAAGCVTLAQQIIRQDGLSAACDPTTLSGCVPFSDMHSQFFEWEFGLPRTYSQPAQAFRPTLRISGVVHLVARHRRLHRSAIAAGAARQLYSWQPNARTPPLTSAIALC